MPTRRGWIAAATGVAFIVGGRLFGLIELYVLGAVALTLVGVATLYVRTIKPAVSVDRLLHPRRVHAEGPSRADLYLRNLGPRPTPVLAIKDSFDKGSRSARFLAAPLQRGDVSRAAYRLPTDRRGIFDVGPLEVRVADPFGFASSTTIATDPTQLTVLPRVDVITPLPRTIGDDPHAGATRASSLLGGGEDFYALRAYVQGDDLRKVHWPSTARLDDLMIRQDEMPWQARATVLLDLRKSVHDESSLEQAVSAAASIFEACRRSNSLIRLVTTDGTDSGFASGEQHAEAVLEHLATVQASRGDRLALAAGALRRSGNGGACAVVTTSQASRADLDSLVGLTATFSQVYLVLFDRRLSPAAPAPAIGDTSGVVVRVAPGRSFAPAWNQALAIARSGRRR